MSAKSGLKSWLQIINVPLSKKFFSFLCLGLFPPKNLTIQCFYESPRFFIMIDIWKAVT